MAKDTDFSTFEGDAMLDLLKGDEESFKKRLSKFDPQILGGLFLRSKDLGREAYKNGDYLQAIEYYTGALALAPDADEKAKLFANRSQCYMQLKRYEDGLKEAHKAIASNQEWSKAWFRAGRCLAAMCRWEAAQAALQRSLGLVSKADAEFKEVARLVDDVTDELEKERKKRRYATDYTRFQKLAEKLVAEETLEKYRKKLEQESKPDIEFASDLTADQRRALELQLTGKVKQPSAKVRVLNQKQIDLIMTPAQNRQPVHEDTMRALLTLQSEGRIADRVVGLAGSPILHSYQRAMSTQLSSDAGDVLFCGCETYPLVLHAYKLRKGRDDIVLHLLNTSVVPIALDLLLRSVVRDGVCEAKDIHIYGKADLKTAAATAEESSLKNLAADDDEGRLMEQGAAAIDEQITKMPTSSDYLVIDPSHIEGYLFGPRNPFRVVEQLHPQKMLPMRIRLKVALATIVETLPAAVSWSLLPERMPRRLKNFIRLQSDFTDVWTLSMETLTNTPPSQMNIPVLATTDGDVSCLIFAVELTMDDETCLDSWRLYNESDTPLGQLCPHLFWLSKCQTESKKSPDNLTLHFNQSVLIAATLSDKDGQVMYRSDQRVNGTSDKFKWEASLGCVTDAAYWRTCLSAYRAKMVGQIEARARQRGIFDEPGSQPVGREVRIRVGVLDMEGISNVQVMLESLLRKKPAGLRGLQVDVDLSVDMFAVAETAAYSYRKALGGTGNLKRLRDACWETAATPKVEWHGNVGKKDETSQWEDDVRAWLFAREENEGARVEMKAGDLHLVRCPRDKETPETRTALCHFFDVPLDTPGVDDATSCVTLPSLWEGLIFGNMMNLPPNGVGSGIVASVIYAKQALLSPTASILPGRLRVLGRLCRFDQTIDPFLPMMNCGRPSSLSSSLPYGKHFPYGEFKVVDAIELKALGAQLHPTTVELMDINFNGDVEDIMKSFNRQRVYKLNEANLTDMSAILVWCEWTIVESSIVCCAPPGCCSATADTAHHFHLEAKSQQALQLLPPLRPTAKEHEIGLQIFPLRGHKDFIVTWNNVRDSDIDDTRIMASDVYRALSDRNAETALKLSNQLIMTPELTTDLVKDVVSLTRWNEVVNEGELETQTLNNFLYFLAA